jgi:hypothetical protein
MLEVIDATNNDAVNGTESLATDFPPEVDSQNQLGEAITNLWSEHAHAKIMARATNEELRALRAKLGEQLHAMKQVLAKPGRGGQWSLFLMERNIPRATADRLVGRHLRSLDPDANCVNEEVSEPTDEEVQKIFNSVWPRLRRVLRTPQSLDRFVDLLTASYQHGGEAADRVIPVLNPAQPMSCAASSDGDFMVESELSAALGEPAR